MDAVHGVGTEKVTSSPSTKHQSFVSDISVLTIRGYVVCVTWWCRKEAELELTDGTGQLLTLRAN
jgi:hypothetical protein